MSEKRNLVAASQRVTSEEIELHFECKNSEQSRFARLEHRRRVAVHRINDMLAHFATTEDRDLKELLANVLTIGGCYVNEINRQKDSVEPIDLVSIMNHLRDARSWIVALNCIYHNPGDVQKIMLALLESAAEFFATTINAGTSPQ